MYLSADFSVSTLRDDLSFTGVVDPTSISGVSDSSEVWSDVVRKLERCSNISLELFGLADFLYHHIGFGRAVPYQPNEVTVGSVDVDDDSAFITIGARAARYLEIGRFVLNSLQARYESFRLVMEVEEQFPPLSSLPEPDPKFHFSNIQVLSLAST